MDLRIIGLLSGRGGVEVPLDIYKVVGMQYSNWFATLFRDVFQNRFVCISSIQGLVQRHITISPYYNVTQHMRHQYCEHGLKFYLTHFGHTVWIECDRVFIDFPHHLDVSALFIFDYRSRSEWDFFRYANHYISFLIRAIRQIECGVSGIQVFGGWGTREVRFLKEQYVHAQFVTSLEGHHTFRRGIKTLNIVS